MYISFYGIIIECIQYFSPYRTYELFDILANELGVILGILISFKLTNNWVIKIEDLITNLSSKY
jgi:VanZ family protein